ncbi:GNAT family N-acetyltransferase [Histidinibacterium lentulum]|uniref:GNAT family N-acetyltransferase n=1 Tax=Histidinibacterium lentulum TaxID=2480588 RepID=A0A3N2QWG9_9RHOB|nr:GNAT family N-acetyltransferase [Histidinibacterium lentulum]ROT99500.1 GNAT family N-acetyltransferase [Histidinibacterium lentulum]
MSGLDYRILRGAEVEAALDDLADLRIGVFREWPYLYDGDHAYERRYLSRYRDAPGAILVGAFDGVRLVGAATGSPMEDHAADFGAAFEARGLPLGHIFYCAESVLLPGYRGRGAGHAFFDAREDHARALGRSHSAFCAVLRPEGHPRRPAEARSLEPFWRGRGYAPLAGATVTFSWRDVGEAEESAKPLQVWMRRL